MRSKYYTWREALALMRAGWVPRRRYGARWVQHPVDSGRRAHVSAKSWDALRDRGFLTTADGRAHRLFDTVPYEFVDNPAIAPGATVPDALRDVV